MQHFEDLPASLSVFPLSSPVLMPGSLLPLNIFEARYIKMVQDAMHGTQLIGMIQPSDSVSPPNLYRVGCAGSITQYEESSDGRLGILLAGLCRFSVTEELASTQPYRIVLPGWSDFASDYETTDQASVQTTLLFNGALRHSINNSDLEADWSLLEELSVSDLANSLLGYLR